LIPTIRFMSIYE